VPDADIGARPGSNASTSEVSVRVRVLSYNIRHGQGVGGLLSNPRIARVIDSIGCDVAGLNEVWRIGSRFDQPSVLGELTRMTPVFHSLQQAMGREIGNLMLSGWDIRSVREIALGGKREARGCVLAEVAASDVTFVFGVTHLSLDRSTRTSQLALLAEELPRDRPLVLVGDFNCAVQELSTLDGLLTFPADVPATYPSVMPFRALDHIGFSSHWALESLAAPPSLASDHRLYVAVSYAESMGRLPKRSLSSSLRWVLRECWLVLWTQPLLPVFQVLGGRMGGQPGGVPIVLVHGYFQNRVDFLYLVRRLLKAGCGPLYAFNFFWPQSLETSSQQLEQFVERVRAQTGASAVDLLTHSSGGLLALDVIAEQPEGVRRAAMIAVPARGVPWRGPVLGRSGSQLRADSLYQARRSNVVEGVPVLSVYSTHDNMVHPVTTSRLEGDRVTNLEVEGPGHLAVLFDRRTADAVCDFLLR